MVNEPVDPLHSARGKSYTDPDEMKDLVKREHQAAQYQRHLQTFGAGFKQGGSYSGLFERNRSASVTSTTRFTRDSAPGAPRMQIHQWSTSMEPFDDTAIGEMLRSTNGGWRPPRPPTTP